MIFKFQFNLMWHLHDFYFVVQFLSQSFFYFNYEPLFNIPNNSQFHTKRPTAQAANQEIRICWLSVAISRSIWEEEFHHMATITGANFSRSYDNKCVEKTKTTVRQRTQLNCGERRRIKEILIVCAYIYKQPNTHTIE